MSLLRYILHQLGLRLADDRTFTLDEELLGYLEHLADEQHRPTEQVLSDLVSGAMEQTARRDELVERWHTLSAREQQAAALACLQYTYRQIASRLHVAPDTVKTYLQKAYVKLGVHNADELRHLLAGWDFSAWEE